MALTRKFLSALGIEEDKAGEIINAHLETVNGLKEEIGKLETANKSLESVQKELDALKNGENPFEIKYNALKTEFETYKTEQAEKDERTAKESAYRELLINAGISEKRALKILKVSDLNGIELDKDGKIKNAADLSGKIKEEWSDFIVSESKKGAETATPPQTTGNMRFSRDEIYRKDDTGRYVHDAAERQQMLTEQMQTAEK